MCPHFLGDSKCKLAVIISVGSSLLLDPFLGYLIERYIKKSP